MNVSYLKRKYHGIEMFIGRKKEAQENMQMAKNTQKAGFNTNNFMSPRMPMS